MRPIVLSSIAAVIFALTPVSGFAGSVAPPRAPSVSPPIILVDGWWEHEHRFNEARERYWRLPPPVLARYNRLQAEIDQLRARRAEIDRRIDRALREQHEILGFRER